MGQKIQNTRFAEFIWVVAIALSITAIFKSFAFELALDAVIMSLAILALVWIHIARSSLSKGSILRKYASSIFICLIFMFLSSTWELGAFLFDFKPYFTKYFLAAAFIFLVISCHLLLEIGQQFGFSAKAKGIKEILAQREKAKR